MDTTPPLFHGSPDPGLVFDVGKLLSEVNANSEATLAHIICVPSLLAVSVSPATAALKG
jgi:hypothetical protein